MSRFNQKKHSKNMFIHSRNIGEKFYYLYKHMYAYARKEKRPNNWPLILKWTTLFLVSENDKKEINDTNEDIDKINIHIESAIIG